jgi:hypothetical protein
VGVVTTNAPDVDDVRRMAINLARNSAYAVFPCRSDKTPACPHGFHDAATDPDRLTHLWANWPGELIGVATGARSNLAVLDVDPDHAEAYTWWQRNYSRLLPTRVYRTRRNGLHLHYQHRDGVKNSQGKLARGIDSRGDGGYCIFWFAAGLPCIDPAPPVPFPDWLFESLTFKSPPPPRSPHPPAIVGGDARGPVDGILRKLAHAREGERNAVLFWAGCRLAERGIRAREAEAMLLPIAAGIGLTDSEARRTIASAMARAA